MFIIPVEAFRFKCQTISTKLYLFKLCQIYMNFLFLQTLADSEYYIYTCLHIAILWNCLSLGLE